MATLSGQNRETASNFTGIGTRVLRINWPARPRLRASAGVVFAPGNLSGSMLRSRWSPAAAGGSQWLVACPVALSAGWLVTSRPGSQRQFIVTGSERPCPGPRLRAQLAVVSFTMCISEVGAASGGPSGPSTARKGSRRATLSALSADLVPADSNSSRVRGSLRVSLRTLGGKTAGRLATDPIIPRGSAAPAPQRR